MARPAGFEPATHGLEGRCSIQLSYGRMFLPRSTIWSGVEGLCGLCPRPPGQCRSAPLLVRPYGQTSNPPDRNVGGSNSPTVDPSAQPASGVRPIFIGRGRGIRTPDILLPKQARYQTALYPEGPHPRVKAGNHTEGRDTGQADRTLRTRYSWWSRPAAGSIRFPARSGARSPGRWRLPFRQAPQGSRRNRHRYSHAGPLHPTRAPPRAGR